MGVKKNPSTPLSTAPKTTRLPGFLEASGFLLIVVKESFQAEQSAYGYLEGHLLVFLKMGLPRPLYHLFSSFRPNLVASRIRTRITGVEGEDTDH